MLEELLKDYKMNLVSYGGQCIYLHFIPCFAKLNAESLSISLTTKAMSSSTLQDTPKNLRKSAERC